MTPFSSKHILPQSLFQPIKILALTQPNASISSAAGAPIQSTQGMTTKVVKGSLWTLSGQVLPLAVSFVATYFVVRMLGVESYGVLILVGLIPAYFSFADFGMSIASTKFGSEAYAAGSPKNEAKVVRTAALISFLTSFPIAAAIFAFSYSLVKWQNVPEHLLREASLALKLSAGIFVLNFLSAVFNTPQLSRLRMDLNTFVTTGFRTAGIIITPIVIYLGGGIDGALTVLLAASFLTLLGHLYVSGRLLKELFSFSIDPAMIKPLLKFGGPLMIGSVAVILLVNLEKGILTSVASVKALAYYSVAFTLANMATMFSASMIQSLIPAFSQLLAPEKKSELNQLFSRGLRLNLIILLPGIAFLFVIAKPFFTIWAGADFGRESTMPFYVLLVGLFFNVIAYMPHSILTATGKTGVFAKLYWAELVPYAVLVTILTYYFGAVGAAAAWSARVTTDAFLLIWLAKKLTGVSFNIFPISKYTLALGLLFFSTLIVSAAIYDISPILLIILVVVYSLLYFVMVWKLFLVNEEKIWVGEKLKSVKFLKIFLSDNM